MENKVIVRFTMMEGCDDLVPAKAHHDDAAYDIGNPQKTEYGIMDTIYFPLVVLTHVQRYLKIYDIRYPKVRVRGIA